MVPSIDARTIPRPGRRPGVNTRFEAGALGTHLEDVVGDGLMPSTILAEVVDAYTPVQAEPVDYVLSDVELDVYDAPQVDGMDL